jgi:hypothetical protein
MARRTAAQAAQATEDDDDDDDDDEEENEDVDSSSPLPELASLPTRRRQETKAQSAKRKKEEEVRCYVPQRSTTEKQKLTSNRKLSQRSKPQRNSNVTGAGVDMQQMTPLTRMMLHEPSLKSAWPLSQAKWRIARSATLGFLLLHTVEPALMEACSVPNVRRILIRRKAQLERRGRLSLVDSGDNCRATSLMAYTLVPKTW